MEVLGMVKLDCGYFPGGPVGKNPPSNAGDTGSIPGQGTKIPQSTGQKAHAPQLEKPTCHNKDPAQPKLRKIKNWIVVIASQQYNITKN